MSSDSQDFIPLVESFVRIHNKFHTLNQKALDYGTGELLFPSEIHFLNAIKKFPEHNLTQLGNALGITRSAASQLSIKLEKRKLCQKQQGQNKRSQYLILTQAGDLAVKSFRQYKNDVFTDLLKLFQQSSEESIQVVSQLFSHLESHFDEILN